MDDLFKPSSFLTLTGCVFAVTVPMAVLKGVFGIESAILTLIWSIAIAILAYAITKHLGNNPANELPWWIQYPIIFLNGCLIYSSALGIDKQVIERII